MGAPNPLAALNTISPSLIGYIGGGGRALGALGNSLANIGQVKLDLQKQNDETAYRNAMLDLSKKADSRASADQQEKFSDKQTKFASNVASNSYLLGKDMPTEMSNDYAKLSLIDPTITAAALRTEKDKYTLGANGLVINTSTGALAGDYRDKSGNGIKGAPYMEGVVNGKVVRTYFDPQTGAPRLNITAPGKPLGIYSQDYADGIGDTNTAQRPKITNNTKQEISAGNAIQDGGLPVRLSSDPRIAKLQHDYLYPTAGGGWYVPANLVNDYKKQFPK
ncbi:hypothetical protein [Sulfuricurvum sp.]|uniref:hypothetical protein n=1 Tax=Sulfuricurvum sp. TaxID=2025608 RepID=UPI002607EF62|nr:hypothetical protein [Sulfuricurvum sp.]MDD2267642.1 hypothetical protein [Sulfuricurvum sp.]MDD2784772.1 hypothetical protein [Sulfuricurvum sp.]